MKKVAFVNSNVELNQLQYDLSILYNGILFRKREELTFESLNEFNPEFIFFIHWSWIIPETIFKNFNCIVFHMTDLPFGRGGSPLQNLILRGFKSTQLTAIKVDAGLDTGDIYLKKKLSLSGTASQIFKRSGKLIKVMIDIIINENLTPVQQTGTAINFKRRLPSESLIDINIDDIEKLYDFIRMLDAENYPQAFLETNKFKFEFKNARIVNKNELKANVRISKK